MRHTFMFVETKFIIIIIIIISFMQSIYTDISETNYVPREYSVAAILLFLFMVHTSPAPVLNLLHFYISTFRSICAVPNMAVFCSSLTSWIPGMLLRYFLNDFEMVPVPPIITGITLLLLFFSCLSLGSVCYYIHIFLLYFFGPDANACTPKFVCHILGSNNRSNEMLCVTFHTLTLTCITTSDLLVVSLCLLNMYHQFIYTS